MKKIISSIVIILLCVSSYSQGHTKVTINIPQVDTTQLIATISVNDPMKKIDTKPYRDTVEVKNGKCQFTFDIENPSFVYLIINHKYVTFPGDYSVIVEPQDNLIFDLPDIAKSSYFGFGLPNIKIRGKGSEKLNLAKDAIIKVFEIYNTDPEFQQQTLTYLYETTDRKLNVIDSTLKENNVVNVIAKDRIKAQLYRILLVQLFRSSLRSENDSVRLLFDKYIVNKRRMDVFFKKNMIKYGGQLDSYLILSEYEKPVTVGGDDYQTINRFEYAELLVKRLMKYPEVRDYLLSIHLISTIRRGLDSTTTKLFKYYCDKADFNNPNYSTVVKTYEETEIKLAEGKSFYNFALPDSVGHVHKLEDFRGKVLVIDFWYNGCGGCRLLVPVLEEIEQQLKGKNVKFVSIGIDKRKLWLEGIGKYSSSSSLQLYTEGQSKDHPMMKYLNIYSYPRLIIVDKDGNITSAPPEPRTDKNSFVKFIESFL